MVLFIIIRALRSRRSFVYVTKCPTILSSILWTVNLNNCLFCRQRCTQRKKKLKAMDRSILANISLMFIPAFDMRKFEYFNIRKKIFAQFHLNYLKKEILCLLVRNLIWNQMRVWIRRTRWAYCNFSNESKRAWHLKKYSSKRADIFPFPWVV